MRKILLRLDKDIYEAVKYQAMENELPISEAIRMAVKNYMKQTAAEEGLDVTTALVRAEVREALGAVEKRLIKILAKATAAAATNMYLSVQCIAAASRRDVAETHLLAQTKAAQYLKAAEE